MAAPSGVVRRQAFHRPFAGAPTDLFPANAADVSEQGNQGFASLATLPDLIAAQHVQTPQPSDSQTFFGGNSHAWQPCEPSDFRLRTRHVPQDESESQGDASKPSRGGATELQA